jgi:hypothetical protein
LSGKQSCFDQWTCFPYFAVVMSWCGLAHFFTAKAKWRRTVAEGAFRPSGTPDARKFFDRESFQKMGLSQNGGYPKHGQIS